MWNQTAVGLQKIDYVSILIVSSFICKQFIWCILYLAISMWHWILDDIRLSSCSSIWLLFMILTGGYPFKETLHSIRTKEKSRTRKLKREQENLFIFKYGGSIYYSQYDNTPVKNQMLFKTTCCNNSTISNIFTY